MFQRFAPPVRAKVQRAVELAQAERASLVEVEHLFTALVDPVADPVGQVLDAMGVSPHSIRDARNREFQSALALVGVQTRRPAPPAGPRQRRGRSTRFAPSAKLALERALAIAVASRERRIDTDSLGLAIVAAEVGIMPRLLAELNTDRHELETLIGHRSPT